MKIPERFPIERIKDYYTHHLGEFENGIRFFGTIDIFNKKYYLLLYLFDEEGNHIDTKHKYSKIPFGLRFPIERMNELDKEIDKMKEEIGSFYYCDIIVKPFQIELEIENKIIIFGLVPSHDGDYSSVDLMPMSTISFTEPWDGSYNT